MKELPNLKELIEEAKEALIVKLWKKIQKKNTKVRETVRKETKENVKKLQPTTSARI
ncbi:hypothetical protein H6F44_19935 [Pseudanabaena sp. FACHB-1277]|uniref:Uncharacterized protein n=1 Tax=Pseudanabaena cinerea FACHB-1277 TaxID=2949581 RepID=A0A926UWX1_9CYAN|nr:hypothetical protein [Pseudanabaena cinerea]MBD2152368.1 hypothetical protein [Pseudanabaena cinerea FACHB-1277]